MNKRKISGAKTKKRIKKINKKSSYLKKVGYLDDDDAETVDYSNDTNLDDVLTVDYNNDNKLSDIDEDIQKVDLKKKSATIAAKKY